ncbi:1722_t:CDS:2 [Diversispora eburnea]|uniref:1722_t:CDS:1 n=1 Tax=Diversispora eburnea TaxID=1213867 RepID=A0A9N8YSY0_9GLOM|nr:1722_t:CDS:2 [Diversispora eburnea]
MQINSLKLKTIASFAQSKNLVSPIYCYPKSLVQSLDTPEEFQTLLTSQLVYEKQNSLRTIKRENVVCKSLNMISLEENSSNNKRSGYLFTDIWKTHMTKGAKQSKRHYFATCTYCQQFWKQGKLQVLYGHLANCCKKYSK